MKNVFEMNYPAQGSREKGWLTVYEASVGLPFEIKRAYLVNDVPEGQCRGFHAHKTLKQLFIAVCGEIQVDCENRKGQRESFVLDSPQKALYCGEGIWHVLHYGKDAILLVLASDVYNEADYIRDYKDFKKEEAE